MVSTTLANRTPDDDDAGWTDVKKIFGKLAAR